MLPAHWQCPPLIHNRGARAGVGGNGLHLAAGLPFCSIPPRLVSLAPATGAAVPVLLPGGRGRQHWPHAVDAAAGHGGLGGCLLGHGRCLLAGSALLQGAW